MIRIERGPEPPLLTTVRLEELERVRQLVVRDSEAIGKEHRAVSRDLLEAQGFKCCYCERFVEDAFHDVEHYRPKARADRLPGSGETHGYWWLAWTWENLLFACPTCNRSGKNDAFPLAEGSLALTAEEPPSGDEHPS